MTQEQKEQMLARFKPRKCGMQTEFDEILAAINAAQKESSHPANSRISAIDLELGQLRVSQQQIQLDITRLRAEKSELLQEVAEVKYFFHGLKHELVKMNPHTDLVYDTAGRQD